MSLAIIIPPQRVNILHRLLHFDARARAPHIFPAVPARRKSITMTRFQTLKSTSTPFPSSSRAAGLSFSSLTFSGARGFARVRSQALATSRRRCSVLGRPLFHPGIPIMVRAGPLAAAAAAACRTGARPRLRRACQTNSPGGHSPGLSLQYRALGSVARSPRTSKTIRFSISPVGTATLFSGIRLTQYVFSLPFEGRLLRLIFVLLLFLDRIHFNQIMRLRGRETI